MNVVDHNPAAWYLLKSEDAYFLSARVSQSVVDYDLLIELAPDEYREYHALGRVYIEYLAARINYWPREYWPRNLSPQARTAVDETIAAWRQLQTDSSGDLASGPSAHRMDSSRGGNAGADDGHADMARLPEPDQRRVMTQPPALHEDP